MRIDTSPAMGNQRAATGETGGNAGHPLRLDDLAIQLAEVYPHPDHDGLIEEPHALQVERWLADAMQRGELRPADAQSVLASAKAAAEAADAAPERYRQKLKNWIRDGSWRAVVRKATPASVPPTTTATSTVGPKTTPEDWNSRPFTAEDLKELRRAK